MNDLGSRIKTARKLRKWSQSTLALACGWEAPSRVGNYEQSTREPTLADIKAIAEALWVAEAWLLTGSVTPSTGGSYELINDVLTVNEYPTGHRLAGEVSPWQRAPRGVHDTRQSQSLNSGRSALSGKGEVLRPILVWEYEDDLPAGDYGFVPTLTLQLAAGTGKIAVHIDYEKPKAFTTEWIRKGRYKPKHLVSMSASGESMSPWINDGDAVVVDRADTTIRDGQAYAIRYGDGLRVKYLHKRLDGGLTLRSLNAPDEAILPVDMEHVEILGLVVWRAG